MDIPLGRIGGDEDPKGAVSVHLASRLPINIIAGPFVDGWAHGLVSVAGVVALTVRGSGPGVGIEEDRRLSGSTVTPGCHRGRRLPGWLARH